MAEASREHEVSRGPARLPDPATSQAVLLAGFLPPGSCPHQPQLLLRLSPQSPPSRSASPPHAPPAVSLLPTPFFLSLLPDAQGQAWGWEERLGCQGHSCGCREGAWDGGAGQQGAHGQAAPGPGCSSCGQPDSGQSHGSPCSELRGALCGLGQVTEPIWASVSPPVKQHLPPTVVMKINQVLGQPGPREARDRSRIEIGNQKRNTALSHIRFGSGEGGREELGKTQALSLGWINGEWGLGWWCLG